MILTRDVILAEMEAGNISIEPFDRDMVGPASVDLHLAGEIRVMDPAVKSIDIDDAADFTVVTIAKKLDRPYALADGETIHGITRERIRLSSNICAWLEGRSKYARLGLMIHVTSGFVNPGVDNRQVLEISNVSGRTLIIHSGTRVCQIVFQRTEGNAVYSGRFADQDKL